MRKNRDDHSSSSFMQNSTSFVSSYESSSNNKLPPLPRSQRPSRTSLPRPSSFTPYLSSNENSLSRRLSIKEIYDHEEKKSPLTITSTSRSSRPGTTSYSEYVTASPSLMRKISLGSGSRPYSTYGNDRSSSYSSVKTSYDSGLRSGRASPTRDFGSSRDVGSSRDLSSSSRRNSMTRLPWPEPSPIKKLPVAPPKPKIRHYPLPPPSYAEGMVALSRRMRNRSASPAPNYAELEISTRPGLVSAALGRPSPSRDMIRMSICGPRSAYSYGRNI